MLKHLFVELRDKERYLLINSFSVSSASAYGKPVTLNFMYDRFMATKFGLKETSYASYYQMYDRYVRDEFGQQLVKNIMYSDIQGFYTFLLKDKNLAISQKYIGIRKNKPIPMYSLLMLE